MKQKEDMAIKNIDYLENYLRDKNVAFFGYKGKILPDIISRNRKARTRVFFRKGKTHSLESGDIPMSQYDSLSEIREELADVYFLDSEAVKVFFAEFPATSNYVFIRLIPRLSWVVALPGLIRRLFIGLVKVDGVVKLKAGETTERWLVVKHMLRESLNTRLCLSSEVGIPKFLEHLKKERVHYTVLRFYEKLPQLNRVGGDLDILVTDEDEHKIREFLQAHPGAIGVDVWTVSRSKHNDITYFPPPVARKIIESAVDGPAGSLIPSPKEAFLSFAYHVLYHKGLFAGVPSCLPGVKVNNKPENDYLGTLTKMAKSIGVEIDMTMESLDEYLHKEGWRPKLDTLAKIAPRNKWVWKRFFSLEATKEIGLGVFILKKKTFELGLTDKILDTIEKYKEFKVLRSKKFSKEEAKYVTDHLRGGVWDDESGTVQDFLPAMAVVVLDTHTARAAKINATSGSGDKRIRDLKKILRRKFDTSKVSFVHATDNTHEAWEYITACFLNEETDVKKEIENAYGNVRLSLMERIKLRLMFTPRYFMYRVAIFKQNTRGKIVRWITK